MPALGWSGVMPFAGALAMAVVRPLWREVALTLFIAYGAVILSFLGGARWGRGMATDVSPLRYAESVLPSLIGFVALMLAHRPSTALCLLAAGFLIWLLIDLRDPLWPPAYRRMRLGISVAVLALHAAWLVV
jgi:hypothetical protein